MPKLIDYPRTSYTGAWEVAEVVDDTGGKCALETCARKLNRKVSGSFKAIVGSAVKFGLLTSKRELLTTTTLFRRIKHAYDKQEELVFHREAFLAPPLFTQLCRKFRARELPVAMLDVLLIREFSVEEINAPNVAKAFVDGARMVGLLDEHNIIADIDQLAAQQPPRRELASPTPAPNVFRQNPTPAIPIPDASQEDEDENEDNAPNVAKAFVDGARMVGLLDEHNIIADIDQLAAQQPPRRELASPTPAPNVFRQNPTPAIPIPDASQEDEDENEEELDDSSAASAPANTPAPARAEKTLSVTGGGPLALPLPTSRPAPTGTADAIANLFGLNSASGASATPATATPLPSPSTRPPATAVPFAAANVVTSSNTRPVPSLPPVPESDVSEAGTLFRIQIVGPGINTQLEVVDVDDLALVRSLLNKIERRLSKEN